MRKVVVIALCLSGCGGLFEVNPDYSGSTGEVGDSSGANVSTTESSADAGSSSGSDPVDPPGSSSSSGGDEGPDVPATCDDDPYEPNDDGQTGNSNLGALFDQGPFEMTANIETSADEDWFKVAVSPPGAVQPAPVVTVASDTELEVCVYVGCAMGTAVADCGTQQDDSSGSSGGGNPGCCGIGSAQLLSYTCEGAVELDGSAYARIRATAPIDACVPYVATFASE